MQILFIANGSIGDCIMSTGLLKHLMDMHPEAQFTIVAGPAAAPLYEAFPKLKRLIIIRKKRWNLHWPILIAQVLFQKWDLVVDLRSSLISYVLWTKRRKVFRKSKLSQSKVEQLSALLGQAFLPTELWISQASLEKARTLLPWDKYVVLAPKSNSAYKDWPIERFTKLAQNLLQKPAFCSSKIVILALANQKEALLPLVNALPASTLVDLSGLTDIPIACAILSRAQLFIGNDSGLLHMAGALKAPLVGLYGPNNDKEYAPRGRLVRIAKVREFEHGEKEMRGSTIINQLTVGQVEAIVDDLFLVIADEK